MCLAIPGIISEIKSPSRAVVDMEGVKKEISIDLIDSPKIGEYVIVHVGYALSKIDASDAQKTIDSMKELRNQ